MAKYKEQLQRIWHQYESEHGSVPATAREAVAWGLSKGLWTCTGSVPVCCSC